MRILRRAIVGLVAASPLIVSGGVSGQPRRQVTIAVGGSGLVSGAVRVAKEMGLFEKHGIDATLTLMDSANAATTALISRSVDVAASGMGEVIFAQSRGQKVVSIKNVYDGLAGVLVLRKAAAESTGVAPDAPIERRLKALEGMIIGMPSASSVYTFSLKGALAELGVNVRFTYLGTSTMATALETGAIQGYMAASPTWAPPIVKGTGILWISGPRRELSARFTPVNSGGVQMMQDVAVTKVDLVRAIVAALTDYTQALDERPADVRAAVGRVYPEIAPEMLDLIFAMDRVGWKTKTLTARDIEHDIQFMKAGGVDMAQIDRVDPGSLLFKAP